jgi:hypothetical protein
MCEKAGTAGGAGAGGAGRVTAGALTVAAVAAVVGDGVAAASRLAIWAWWSSKSALDSTARGRVMLVGVAGGRPSTIAVGTATARVRPTTVAVRTTRSLMTRLTRSGAAVLRIARCVTQRAGESICLVHTLYTGRRA